jgi:hypothetical protein
MPTIPFLHEMNHAFKLSSMDWLDDEMESSTSRRATVTFERKIRYQGEWI